MNQAQNSVSELYLAMLYVLQLPPPTLAAVGVGGSSLALVSAMFGGGGGGGVAAWGGLVGPAADGLGGSAVTFPFDLTVPNHGDRSWGLDLFQGLLDTKPPNLLS